jgi:hypothetical protein
VEALERDAAHVPAADDLPLPPEDYIDIVGAQIQEALAAAAAGGEGEGEGAAAAAAAEGGDGAAEGEGNAVDAPEWANWNPAMWMFQWDEGAEGEEGEGGAGDEGEAAAAGAAQG